MTDPTDQPGYRPDPPASVSGGAERAPSGRPPVTEPALNDPPPLAEPAAPARRAPGFDDRGKVRASKVSGVWVGLIGTALFLILLIVFIGQNSRKISLHFFGWHGQFSLALTILLSAVIGVLLVAIPGSVRILQLRSALRKNGPGRDGRTG
jgi:uncharacterized integral membrane protein